MSTAAGWEKWNDWYRESNAPLFERMLELAAIGPGMRVLDVACGTGQPAIPAALRGATVVAIDVAADMLAGARRLAHSAGVDDIDFREMNAEELGFADASFDALTCGFGLMFPPDPLRVVREMRRVLRPGAAAVIAVWDDRTRNPMFTTAIAALAPWQIPAGPPPDPKGPGAFRFAPPGALEEVLRAGGFSDVAVEPFPFTLPFTSVAHHWDVMTDMLPPLKALAQNLPAAEVAKLRAALAAALAPYLDGERVRLPASALLARAS